MRKLQFATTCVLCLLALIGMTACSLPGAPRPTGSGPAARVMPTYTPLPTYTPNPTPECKACAACQPTSTPGPALTSQPPCPTCAPPETSTPTPSPSPSPRPTKAQPQEVTPTATITATEAVVEGPVSLKMIVHNNYFDPWVDLELAPGGVAKMFWKETDLAWGEIAATIGDKTYKLDRKAMNPDAAEQHLPEPYKYEFAFSQNMIDKTRNKVGGNSQTGEWWAGPLNCSSSTTPPEPFEITVKLKKGDEVVSTATFSFSVSDVPSCDAGKYGE